MGEGGLERGWGGMEKGQEGPHGLGPALSSPKMECRDLGALATETFWNCSFVL